MNKAINMARKIVAKSAMAEYTVYVFFLLREIIVRGLFFLCGLLPKEDKVVFCAMKGDRFGDNPLAICDALTEHNKNIRVTWILNENVDAYLAQNMTRVCSNSLGEIKELATAKVWVDSNLRYSGFIKRKDQLYIQTWHGSYGLKKIGFDVEMSLIDKRNFKYAMKRTDVMISNSERTSEIFRKAFRFNNEIMLVGSPRNDLLLSDSTDIKTKVGSVFKCDGKNIVLYAPTYRNDYSVEVMNLDFERIRKSFEDNFGGNWVLFIRMHYKNLTEAEMFFDYTDNIKNASDYSNMQELLLAADVLITDYSSCMFDFITVPKPCFIYAPDLEEYESDRGNYYKMSELPFSLAKTNDELVENIKNFDMDAYEDKVHKLHERVGLNETGHASEKVADYIINFIKSGKK